MGRSLFFPLLLNLQGQFWHFVSKSEKPIWKYKIKEKIYYLNRLLILLFCYNCKRISYENWKKNNCLKINNKRKQLLKIL